MRSALDVGQRIISTGKRGDGQRRQVGGGTRRKPRLGSLERRRAEVNLRMVLVKVFMGLMARGDVRLQKAVIVRAHPHSNEQVSTHLMRMRADWA
jgi:hypothetical protein